MNRVWTIYLLRDPRDPLVGYVGQTREPVEVRLKRHLRTRAARSGNARRAWIEDLHAAGLVPTIEALETCSSLDEANVAERRWIEECRAARGMTLVNTAPGGYFVYDHTGWRECIKAAWQRPESRARKAKASREAAPGIWRDPSKRARRVAGMKRSWTEERRQAARARWADPEWRANTLARQKAAFAAPDERARKSRVTREQENRPERQRAKSARMKELWANHEWRARTMASRTEARAG